MSSESTASDRHRAGQERDEHESARPSRSSKAAARSAASTVEITLAHSRWRHLSWVIFGVLGGGLLIAKLGTVGKYLGILLLLVAAWHVSRFVRTLMRPAGLLAVGDEAASLPLGLCRGNEDQVSLADIQHVFLLRRAVPWMHTGPLLVIETKARAYTYPRDWFHDDRDQTRVLKALRKRLARRDQ